jgi:hypothetical protein
VFGFSSPAPTSNEMLARADEVIEWSGEMSGLGM